MDIFHLMVTQTGHLEHLITLDYILYGFLRSKVYIEKPTTLWHSKRNIRAQFDVICKPVFKNFAVHIGAGRRARGKYVNDVIVPI